LLGESFLADMINPVPESELAHNEEELRLILAKD
jgi:hypothetical protein